MTGISFGRLAALAACLGMLAACGNGDRPAGLIVGERVGGLFGLGADSESSAELPEGPRILVFAPTVFGARDFGIAGVNGDKVTWTDGAGHSITLRDGQLIATRGFGEDLIAGDPGATAAALRAGGGTSVRHHDYLSGEDRLMPFDMACMIVATGSEAVEIGGQSIQAEKLVETCQGPLGPYQNMYWLGADGLPRRSIQFASYGIGSLVIDRLTP